MYTGSKDRSFPNVDYRHFSLGTPYREPWAGIHVWWLMKSQNVSEGEELAIAGEAEESIPIKSLRASG
jgi:hypothetical protein